VAKRVGTLFLVILLVLSFASCSKHKTQKYSHCELSIPLTSDFKEVADKDYDVSYSNGKYAVAVLRISFVAAVREGISETMTAHAFGEFWLERCNRRATVKTDGVSYCEYYDQASGTEFYYMEAFYRTSYAYFVLLFAAPSIYDDAAFEDFLAYARGVTISD